MPLSNNKNDSSRLSDGFMEKIFNFPRLYRLKLWIVNRTFQLIQPVIVNNYFTFNEVLHNILPERSSVFEIGCGDGNLYQGLISGCNNLKYIGSDINKSMVDHCKTQYPNANWLSHNSLPYPYPDDYFDFCIIENVLHHLNSFEEVCNMLIETLRIGKRVVFYEPIQSDNRFLYLIKSLYWRITDGGKFYFTYSEFQDLFKTVGAILKWEKVTKPLHQIYCCEISRHLIK